MNHDPEQLAAAYLTTMRPRARRRFEPHLLACESCWLEVSLGRRGRRLAETARDVAPAQLREDIRAAVAAAAMQAAASPRTLRRGVVAAAVALAVLAGTAVLVRPWPHSPPAASVTPPAVITAAVTSYRANRLPGTAVPAELAPNLASLRLRLVGAAAGQLHGVAVAMFAYRAPTGARLTIVRSSQPLPEATHARELGGTEAAWTVRYGGVTVICARGTHAMLLLGTNAALVRQASALLNAI